MRRGLILRAVVGITWVLGATGQALDGAAAAPAGEAGLNTLDALRLAVEDLAATFGQAYPQARAYLDRLGAIDPATPEGQRQLDAIRSEALLANPLLDFEELLVVRRVAVPELTKPAGAKPLPDLPQEIASYADAVEARKRFMARWNAAHPTPREQAQFDLAVGLPRNHQSNSSLPRTGYENAIVALSLKERAYRTVYAPPHDGYVGEVDLHFDADRLLFSMSDADGWQVYELRLDGSEPKALTRSPEGDVDNYDACYTGDGLIVFASTASMQTVPCWHGIQAHRVANLYRMNEDGTGIRQLCFDQDHNHYPSVLGNGQIVYTRWEYAAQRHEYLRILMAMNPDGTGQRALYGTNSWWPNSLYHARAIPGHPTKLVSILSGYHGVVRQGDLLLIDTARGWKGTDGVVQKIPGRGEKLEPIIKEKLVIDHWPKFMHPYPLSDKYFLAACRPTEKDNWGIYLADVFNNLVPVATDPGAALIEPIPLRKQTRPPVIPERVNLEAKQAVVYLHDVYAGPGLKGVPRGTIRNLRVMAYHFNYPGIGGTGKVGMGGPWEVVRILGTTPVYEDGSAQFLMPANTPIAFQPLDKDGAAVQLMRSWVTAMPGEMVSCVGCHEEPRDAPPSRFSVAAQRPPARLTPWYGPARGFDFEREVQPVLDRHCAGCHDGKPGRIDLRPEAQVPDYEGMLIHPLEQERLAQSAGKEVGAQFGIRMRYTPAYDALLPYVRRPGTEDGVDLLIPGEYHADTSMLVQLLKKGHHGVALDAECWDRVLTWIDLNAPCHGTFNDVYEVPAEMDARREALRALYGGPAENPERVFARAVLPQVPARPSRLWRPKAVEVPAAAIPTRSPRTRTVRLGNGVAIELAWIPAGTFHMGEASTMALPDERPVRPVDIDQGFWMATTEVTNAQFALFDPEHDSGYCPKHGITPDAPGLWLNGPDQPVVRVTQERAAAFCAWLSREAGFEFTLPTEDQWEYACRAGSQMPWHYGDAVSDFSRYANLADRAMGSASPFPGHAVEMSMVGWSIGKPYDMRFDDGQTVTAAVKSYAPNAWGLYDMHGNVAEWTASAAEDGRRVVRGGSWIDRPDRARAAFRLTYPAWRGVHDVGFRVILRDIGSRDSKTENSDPRSQI